MIFIAALAIWSLAVFGGYELIKHYDDSHTQQEHK